MHAYSAIPDIKADTKAGLDTIATLLGRGWTHAFCIACFAVAAIPGGRQRIRSERPRPRLYWLDALVGYFNERPA